MQYSYPQTLKMQKFQVFCMEGIMKKLFAQDIDVPGG